MSDVPNSIATTADFEFKALQEAKNYRASLVREFGRYLRGEVLEVGAGIGQITDLLVKLPSVKKVTGIEPDAAFCASHRSTYPTHDVIQGTVNDLPAKDWDAIVSINVLEHIEDDRAELARYARLLAKRRGHFCLFVPARPELFSPIDKDFGHFRRYTQPELSEKLSRAGFEIVRLNYFNFTGYFAWWLNFRFLKKRGFDAAKVRLFDRVIFPINYFVESRIMHPPFGQSLIAVGQSQL